MMRVFLLGGGGHAKVLVDILESMRHTGHAIDISGFFDDDSNRCLPYGVGWKGSIDHETIVGETKKDEHCCFLLAVGQNKLRFEWAQRYSVPWYIAIHPSAVVSLTVAIGEGSVIMPLAVVNAEARIGKHAIINTSAVVEHDCHVSDYAHVSPHATLCGNVSIGLGVHVGAGATVLPGVKIGDWSVIGAGAVVTRDVPALAVVKGVPAR